MMFRKSAVYCAVIAFFSLLVSGCTNSIQSSTTLNTTRIFNVAQQRYIHLAELAEALADTPIILVGEQHDRAQDHLAEQRLLQQFALFAPSKSVALEMFVTSEQARIQHAQAQIRQANIHNPIQIRQLLNWDQKWDWAQYQALISQLALSSSDIYGANLNRAEIDTILQGAYPLQGQKSTTSAVKVRLQQLIAQSHHLDNADPFVARLVEVQQFKDRRMAEVLAKQPKPILFIGGRHHVSKLIGIPLHLEDYQQSNYQVIMFTTDKNAISPAETDYIWEL